MSYTLWKIPGRGAKIPQGLLDMGCTPLLAAVLAVRGYGNAEAANEYINCGESLLCDPLMMTEMPQAVGRLARAIRDKERVAVFGDYDVDGITSSCMIADYLRAKGLKCEVYIPSRIDEGYGLNVSAIQSLKESGVSLIITVDCGVTATEEAAYASTVGVDMIITDHHECREELPGAIAVINPKRPDCNYPNRDLAGAGVAFKLLCALEGSPKNILDKYSDLVAVGTIADVMPLVGENRYIIKRGLQKLRENPRLGLKALMDEAGLAAARLSATSVGFSIAPRINAAGRMGQADVAANLLLSASSAEASRLAAELCQLNRDRQALETEIWKDALGRIDPEKQKTPIVLASDSWHQGVIGIAASRLTEAFKLPAVMICLSGDMGKGSCRSFGGFNLFEALSACSEHLEGYGGHALAAGLTIHRDKIADFTEALGKYYALHPADKADILNIDLVINSPELLSMRCVEDLESMEPCGNQNPKACLCIKGAVLESITAMGGGKHLRLRVNKFGQSYEAVFFSRTVQELGVSQGDSIDIAFFPQINEFRGRRSVQLLVTDIRPCDLSGCEKMLSGSYPESMEHIPGREDFARVWCALKTFGGRLKAPLQAALDAIDAAADSDMLCLCLAVLRELKLLQYEYSGGTLDISIADDGRKVVLSDSAILSGIKPAEG